MTYHVAVAIALVTAIFPVILNAQPRYSSEPIPAVREAQHAELRIEVLDKKLIRGKPFTIRATLSNMGDEPLLYLPDHFRIVGYWQLSVEGPHGSYRALAAPCMAPMMEPDHFKKLLPGQHYSISYSSSAFKNYGSSGSALAVHDDAGHYTALLSFTFDAANAFESALSRSSETAHYARQNPNKKVWKSILALPIVTSVESNEISFVVPTMAARTSPSSIQPPSWPTFSIAGSALARVGNQRIHPGDLEYIIKSKEAAGYRGDVEAEALLLLITDLHAIQVGIDNGVCVTGDQIDAYERTFSDDKVRKLFTGNRDAFRRLVLFPSIVHRVIREKFVAIESNLLEEQRRKIERAMALILAGDPFDQAAQATGLDIVKASMGFPSKREIQHQLSMGHKMSPFRVIMSKLEVGQVHGEIYEDNCAFKIVRLTEKRKRGVSYHSIVAQKPNFQSWFSKQVKNTTVECFDESLAKILRRNHNNYNSLLTIKYNRLVH